MQSRRVIAIEVAVVIVISEGICLALPGDLLFPGFRGSQNVEEFKKVKVAAHVSSIDYKEDSYDQMLFKDLVQKFLLQQKNNVKFESAEF